MSSARRGSQVVEFALVLPILLTVVSGVIDAGEYLHQNEALINAAADGARTGARSESDVAAAAEAAADASWGATLGGREATFSASVEGSAPDQRVSMEASMAFEPSFGLLPMPSTIAYRCAFRLDHQPEE